MKPIIANLIALFLCSSLLFTACDDNSSNNDEATPVEGLWKLQSTEGDVSYLNITATVITDYDYMGDAFDEGDDCYDITTLQIAGINGDIYTIADPALPGSTIAVKITSVNNILTVEQPMGNGVIIVKFDRFNGNTADFTPECAEETSMDKSNALGF